MAFEIAGARMLAPFVGTSSIIWTSIIGVVLASLSLGNWLGGRLADKRQDVAFLSGILAVSALLIVLLVLSKDPILTLITQDSDDVRTQTVIAALILFAPISTVLGLAGPYATRLNLVDISTSGRIVGLFSAIGSIGSIFGTFAAGFWLLPTFGTNRVLIIIAAFLFLLSLLVGGARYLSLKAVACLLLVTSVPILARVDTSLAAAGVHDLDTEYSRVIIERRPWGDGRLATLMRIDKQFSSGQYTDSDELVFPYAYYYQLDSYFTKKVDTAVLLGGAGFTVNTDFLARNPTGTITVVEIDPKLEEIAREFFRLKDDPRLRLVTEDARTFFNRNEAKYDAIYMDAFSTMYSVPFQLTTKEFVEKISAGLSDDGTYITNAIGTITGEKGQFVRALLSTYRSVFPFVEVYPVQSPKSPGELQNIMIVAKKQAFTPHREPTPAEQLLLDHRYTDEISEMPILTDDHAPVEQYTLPLL